MNGRSADNYYLTLYANCKEFNCLPHDGGWLDQPAKTVEAFEIIQRIINQYRQNGGE